MDFTIDPLAARRTGVADPLATSFLGAPLCDPAPYAPFAAELLELVSTLPRRDDIIERMLVQQTLAGFGASRDGVYGIVRSPSHGPVLALGVGLLLGAALMYAATRPEPEPAAGGR